MWTTIVARRLYPQNRSLTPVVSPGIREKMRIELVVIRETSKNQSNRFQGEGAPGP
jgi:hypothetical protein